MSPTTMLNVRAMSPVPLPRGRTTPSTRPVHDDLGRNSDRPEVQDAIRDAIRRGVVRVRPCPGSPGRVEVYPAPPDSPNHVTPRGG
jgi:hypothetical protein